MTMAVDNKRIYEHVLAESLGPIKDKLCGLEALTVKDNTQSDHTHFRWIDGSQTLADCLAKVGAGAEVLTGVLANVEYILGKKEELFLRKLIRWQWQ